MAMFSRMAWSCELWAAAVPFSAQAAFCRVTSSSAVIARLADGERSIGELAVPFAMSFAGASKHVRVLEQAGIVRRRRADDAS